MDWRLASKRILLETRPFSVEELSLERISSKPTFIRPHFRIQSADWVNIFAITSEGKVLLVRQPRAGIMTLTLEVPGGGVEPGEDPLATAHRELEEETGYRAGQMRSLGVVSPNPAIMANKLHMFLAEDCFLPQKRQHFPDTSEEIEIQSISMAELNELIRKGELQNALSNLTILMAQKYVLKT